MRKIVSFILLFLILTSVSAQVRQYKPDWADLKERPYPQWFRDAKLGIFIHWSLSSVPAWSGKEQYAEWFLRGLMTGDSARISFQEKVFGDGFTYENYAPLFKGELFNAAEWADLFSEAGARYVVFVSKHHDGYCLWPSKFAAGWNSMGTGPHRDIVGELTSAVKAKGLKMGLYYSLPEWNNSLYRWGTDPAEKVNRYVDEHMIPQFKELISSYKPSLVFADGEWDHPASTWHSSELISWYYNLLGEDAIVNDRWGSGSDGIGFRTPEYSSGMAASDRPWAEVRGLGRSFGLNRNESIDAYMSPADLVHFFVKAVAGGGGMILNVGPYCDGQIPLLQQERLLQLGRWLKVNGEAIYGSTANAISSEEKPVELTRIDSTIDFDWVRNSPGRPILEDDFTSQWTGFIEPAMTGNYSFGLSVDDGARVWVDDILVAQKWPADPKMEITKLPVSDLRLETGHRYPIRIEYYETKQNASLSLFWWSDKIGKSIIPSSSLFVTDAIDSPHGLKACYHSKATWLCYTRNRGNFYAIALEWPSDNKLKLSVKPASKNCKVTLLGRAGELPWKLENDKMIVDLNSIKISELPCEWAWTFRISGE